MTTVNTVKVQGGADYAMVVNRVHRFVEDHETGQIHTEIVKDENGHVIFKAYALIDGVIRGTGHAHELEGSSNINKTSHYEACETQCCGKSFSECVAICQVVKWQVTKKLRMLSCNNLRFQSMK